VGVVTTDPRAAYTRESTDLSLRALGTVAAALGAHLAGIVVVGGMVPYLLVDQTSADEPHAGTTDLDLALSISLISSGSYKNLPGLLRAAGFTPDSGFWRWRHPSGAAIDLLIKTDRTTKGGNKTKWLVPNELTALANEFVLLAERAPRDFPVRSGTDLHGGQCREVTVRVCAPAPFMALKAYALQNRAKPKDAYDLYYMLRHYGLGLRVLAEEYAAILNGGPLAERKLAERGLNWLRQHYEALNSPGPAELVRFMGVQGAEADELRADAWGVGRQFVRGVESATR
jgi:hypothetical protein